MRKITKKELIQLMKVWDCEVETEHRRGSSFYATAWLDIDKEIVDATAEDGIDISELEGKQVVATGYWSDNDGLDLDDVEVREPYEVHVPEKVIPATTEVRYKRIDYSFE